MSKCDWCDEHRCECETLKRLLTAAKPAVWRRIVNLWFDIYQKKDVIKKEKRAR